MALIKSFCFCCNVRSGSMFCAIYSLLSSCFYMGIVLVRYVGYRLVENSVVHSIVTYTTFGFFGLLSLTSILLIVGVHADRPSYFIPWIIQTVLTMMMGTASVCWVIIFNLHKDQVVHPWEVGILLTHIANVIMNVYCLFCVFSQFQDLSHGKGTNSYYRRRRRARRRQTVLIEDMVTSSTSEHGNLNLALSMEDVPGFPPQDDATMPPMCPPPPYYQEPPPAYSTLPREEEATIQSSRYPSRNRSAPSPQSQTGTLSRSQEVTSTRQQEVTSQRRSQDIRMPESDRIILSRLPEVTQERSHEMTPSRSEEVTMSVSVRGLMSSSRRSRPRRNSHEEAIARSQEYPTVQSPVTIDEFSHCETGALPF